MNDLGLGNESSATGAEWEDGVGSEAEGDSVCSSLSLLDNVTKSPRIVTLPDAADMDQIQAAEPAHLEFGRTTIWLITKSKRIKLDRARLQFEERRFGARFPKDFTQGSSVEIAVDERPQSIEYLVNWLWAGYLHPNSDGMSLEELLHVYVLATNWSIRRLREDCYNFLRGTMQEVLRDISGPLECQEAWEIVRTENIRLFLAHQALRIMRNGSDGGPRASLRFSFLDSGEKLEPEFFADIL